VAQTSPTFRRRRLARRLRQMREQAKMTLEDAAPRLDKTRSSLGRIETGISRADVHLIRSMMDLYDHYDPDLLDMARAANRPAWWTPFFRRCTENRGYVGLEADAVSVLEFSLAYVPGLLQTERYMRAVLDSELMAPRDAEQLENEVTVRLRRQRRLTDEDDPLELVAIVDESAIRRPIGGPAVMREQLTYLIDRARLPHASLHIIPNEVGMHVRLQGPFAILEYEWPEPMLYIDHVRGALHVDDPAELRRARALFDHLESLALSGDESLRLIEKIADEH